MAELPQGVAISPPEQPKTLCSLELDKVTQNLVLNQEPLLRYLRKVVSHLRDFSTKGISEIRHEYIKGIRELDEALREQISEKCHEVDRSVRDAFAPRIDKLEKDAPLLEQSVSSHVKRLEESDAELQSRLGVMNEELTKQASLDVNDIKDVQKILRGFEKDNETAKDRLRSVEDMLNSEVEALTTICMSSEDAVRQHHRKLEAQVERIADLEEGEKQVRLDLAAARGELKTLALSKAEEAALKETIAEVRAFGRLAERGAEAAEVVPRVASLEKTRRSFDALLEKMKQSMEELRQSEEQLRAKTAECAENIAAAEKRAVVALDRRCGEIATQGNSLTARMHGAEAQLGQVARLLEGWGSKADSAELASLRGAVGSMAEDLKDREQAVLFGARCLSCNRVFDDVQQESGVVNLRGERQKAHVFAEIQRALHSPKCDPLEPVNLIAVRVGRTGGIKSRDGMGPFAGRDGSNMARGLEDVQLLPAKPAVAAASSGRPRSVGQALGGSSLPPNGAARPATTSGGTGGASGRGAGRGLTPLRNPPASSPPGARLADLVGQQGRSDLVSPRGTLLPPP